MTGAEYCIKLVQYMQVNAKVEVNVCLPAHYLLHSRVIEYIAYTPSPLLSSSPSRHTSLPGLAGTTVTGDPFLVPTA